MATWPIRGQQAPDYWDTQLHTYIDENDEAALEASAAAVDDAASARSSVEALEYLTNTGRLASGQVVASVTRPAHAPALGLYFPEADGALGDGTADDTAAWALTLTAARAGKGRVLLQPGKTYLVSSTLNPADTVIEGYGATVKQKAGVTGFPMFQSTTGPVNIEGVTLDGNRANTTAPGSISTSGVGIYVFRSAGGDMGSIRNVIVKNMWGPAVRVGSSRFTDPRNNNRTSGSITRLLAMTCGEGIFLDAARDVQINSCQLLSIDRCGVQDNYGCDNSVSDSTVDGVATGFGLLTQYSWGFKAIGNSVRRTGTNMVIGSGLAATGIQVGGGDTAFNVAQSFVISDNAIEDCYHYGISIDPTLVGSPGVVQTAMGTISGNVVFNCGTRAFAQDPSINGGSGIYLHNAGQISVTGNTCKANRRAGIIDDGLDNTVSGNTLIDNIDYGVEIRCGSTETKGRGTLGPNTYRGNGLDVFISQYAIAGDRTLPGSRSAYKTADQTVTNTVTVTPDNHLVFGNMQPGVYEIIGMLVVDSTSVADFRAAWTVPAGTDLTWTMNSFLVSASSSASPIYREPVVVTGGNGTIGTATAGNITAGAPITSLPRGTIKITTPGTVTFRFAQVAAEASNTTLKAGSYLTLRRIA